ncbi:MAG: hypothetical protein AB7O97_22475 [Planctomycetota bacterium]
MTRHSRTGRRGLRRSLCLLAWAAAAWVGGFDPAQVGSAATALTRPLVLPFLWRSLGEAERLGDPAAAFAQAQLLLRATPGWTDGHIVFAWRYALDGSATAPAGTERTRAAADRLQVALAVLDRAAEGPARRPGEVWDAMAWLVELATRKEPALADLLPEAPVLLADRYRARAEAAGADRSVGAWRLYDVPRIAAVFLRAGDRARALQVMDDGIDRCAGRAAGADLEADWCGTLRRARAALAGDPAVDAAERAALAGDIRLESLATFLR